MKPSRLLEVAVDKKRGEIKGIYSPFSITKEVAGIHLVKVIPVVQNQFSKEKCFNVWDVDQCLDGFSLYFAFSSSLTGARRCLAKAVAMVSTWSSGNGT